MSRKKIILYGLIGVVAGGILIADNLSGSGDSATIACPAAPASLTASAGPAGADSPALAGASAQCRFLARHLKILADARHLDPRQTPDAFALPAGWRPQPTGQDTDAAKAAGVKVDEPEFHLSALMVSHQGAWAIINDKVIYLNQEINGYRLVGITDQTAVLAKNKREINLALKPPLADVPVMSRPATSSEQSGKKQEEIPSPS